MTTPPGSFRWANYFDVAGTAGRYPILDALRAAAIILVLLRHGVRAAADAFGLALDNPLLVLAANGWIGVDLFFVLSGFLIASHFTGAGAAPLDRSSLAEFFKRRALRTMPLYWGVIGLCWLAAPATGSPGWSMNSFSVHFLFLQDYLGSDVMVTLWSLAVEEKFYMLAPLLMLLLARAGWRAAVLALVLLMVMIIWSMWTGAGAIAGARYPAWFWSLRSPFHHAVLGILAGVFVAVIAGARKLPAIRSCRPWWACVAGLLLLHFWVDWTSLAQWTWASAAIAVSTVLFAALVALGVSINRWRPQFGAGRGLRHTARLSYSLYLVHYPLLPVAVWLTRAVLDMDTAQASVGMAVGVFCLFFILLSWTGALALHYVIEKPFLLMRERRGQLPALCTVTPAPHRSP